MGVSLGSGGQGQNSSWDSMTLSRAVVAATVAGPEQ